MFLLDTVLLMYPDLEDRIFNRVISDISAVLRETTLTISDAIQTDSPVESENSENDFPYYNGNNRNNTHTHKRSSRSGYLNNTQC